MLGRSGVVWAPVAVGALTVLGLIVALAGGSAWAFAAWIALAAPLILIAERLISSFRPRRPRDDAGCSSAQPRSSTASSGLLGS